MNLKTVFRMLVATVAAVLWHVDQLLGALLHMLPHHIELPGTLGRAVAFYDRWKWRIAFAALATVGAFAVVEPLAQRWGDVAPEIPRVLPALAVMFWGETSFNLLRTAMHPGADLGALIEHAATTPEGASRMARMLNLGNLARLGMFLCIVYAPV